MKKLLKLCLAAAIAFSVVTVTGVVDRTPIVAMTYGDFTYVVSSDGNAEIKNYAGHDTIVTVPEELEGLKVTAIGYGAFAECRGIEQIILPDTVTSIDDNAFSKCTDLVSIILPDSVRAMGANVFKDCVSLKNVTLPNGLVALPKGMFSGCESLEKIALPENLTSIADSVFSGCTSLTEINIPSGVRQIGSSAFKECKALTAIVLPEGVKTIGSSAFADSINLKDVSLPSTLTGISQSAFQNCISLESIELPHAIQTLGYSIFSGCSALSEVILPDNLTGIPESAFSGCSSLQRIVLPDSVKEIGATAFSACINLEEIIMPDSLTTIGTGAFSYCNSLITFTFPSKVREIPANMFLECDNLQYVVVPKTVTSIGDTAFAYCPSLESVTLPLTISSKNFGSRVFSNSANVVLSVPVNSGAYSYAVNNNVKYKLLQETINLNMDEMEILKGDSKVLKAVQKDGTTLDGDELTWISSDPSIASVKNGFVTAHKKGTATITATRNGVSDTCVVTVDDRDIPIESITLSQTELSAHINNQIKLKATIDPVKTTEDDAITWTSSDPNIAIVSGTGTVITKSVGTVEITASVGSGKKAVCVVTVTSPITGVTMNPSKPITLESGTAYQFRASVEPLDTTDNTDLTWESSNPDSVTVTEDGLVTAVSEGSAYIRAIAENGNKASCQVYVKDNVDKPITSVQLDKTALSLVEGDDAVLKATINPSDTTDDKTLTWSSDNEKVATVDENGNIHAVVAGTATITVTTSNGKSAACVVSVEKKEVPIISVELNENTLKLTEGDGAVLEATINPADTTDDKTLTWSSDNEKVVTIDGNGNVHAVAAGTATITVTTSNGKSDTCVVTVAKKEIPITSVALDVSETTLRAGNSLQLHATILPEDTTMEKDITWTSSDDAVVTVDANGVLTAVGEGDAVITAASVNGVSATCSVHVFAVSLDALQDSVDRASALQADDYTTSSYAEVQKALEAAKDVLADKDAKQTDIDAAQKNLEAAMQALEARAEEAALTQLELLVEAAEAMKDAFTAEEFADMQAAIDAAQVILDKDSADVSAAEAANAAAAIEEEKAALTLLAAQKEVQAALVEAEAILADDTSMYEPVTVAALKAAVSDAKAILENPQATAEQLKNTAKAVYNAIASLKPVEEEDDVDTSDLRDFIAIVEDANKDNYTGSSWKEFQAKLDAAKAVLKDENATQDEVDAAYEALIVAYFSMEDAPSYAALELEIEMAEAILAQSDDFYASTIKSLPDALAQGKTVLEDKDATQEEVDAAVKVMREARLQARKKPL